MYADTERDAQANEARNTDGHLTALMDAAGVWHPYQCSDMPRCLCI